MSTITAPVWLLAVLGGLAAIGFLAVCWLVAGRLERAADWWHDRPRIRWIRDWWYDRRKPLADEDKLRAEAAEEMGYFDGPPLGLPPERTWEQMTSHQLPMTVEQQMQRELDRVAREQRHEMTSLSAANERRAPWWEAEHRAAYESLGFDYPSGLMARVRELTP